MAHAALAGRPLLAGLAASWCACRCSVQPEPPSSCQRKPSPPVVRSCGAAPVATSTRDPAAPHLSPAPPPSREGTPPPPGARRGGVPRGGTRGGGGAAPQFCPSPASSWGPSPRLPPLNVSPPWSSCTALEPPLLSALSSSPAGPPVT